MGHRSITLLLSAFFAVAASNVFALGLGKIKLESSLNQTLQAEIELFEVRDLVEEEIRVGVASREDFERIGVDKVYFLSDLAFDVKLSGPGSPKVIVTSTKLVREPFLNFVVEVKWPSGKLLREYTLLLDLPAFSEQTAPAVQPTVSQAAPSSSPRSSAPATASDSSYNPRSAFEEGRSRASSAPVSPSYTGDSYRVQSNDTLWEIAASVRPDREVSIHQTMISIQRVNPDAFINNNINLLKEGRVLRIPDREEMAQLNRTQAVREVAEQNSQWSGGASDTSGAELSGSSSYDDSGSSTAVSEGRLKLASPDDAYGSSEGRASGGDADVSIDALENELSSTLEQMDKTSRENSELRSKVESLEEQIATMERMIEVTNESLRAQELAAQKQAQERDAAAQLSEDLEVDQEQAIDVASDLESGSEQSDTSALYSDDESSLDATPEPEPVVTPAPTVAATPVPDAKRVVAPPAVKEKGIIDIILENILYIVGGIVVLVAGAVYFIMRRSSAEDDEFDEFMDDQRGETPVVAVGEAPGAHDDELDLGDFSANIDEPSSELDNDLDIDIDIEQEEEADSEAQTEDVVAEADIYIAYGKFDQAEEMLKRALEKEPNDEDIRLKLIEVYSSQGDGESFDQHYAKLRSYASPSVLERADSLRQNIPNIAEFDEARYGGSSAASSLDHDDTTQIQFPKSSKDDDLSLDIDDSLSLGSDDLDIDFDMDLSDDSSSSSSGDDDLDFDLEGFDATGDFGNLGLDDDSSDKPSSSLEDDLDALESEIDLSVSFDKPAADTKASLDDLDDLGDFDLSGDGLDFDLEDGLDDLDMDSSKGLKNDDTTVNQALNDEYIEQKLSEDADLDLDLDESLPLESDVSKSSTSDDLDDGGDLDLSALDEELDALTAGLGDDLGADSLSGIGDSGLDFDDFDKELEGSSTGAASKGVGQDKPSSTAGETSGSDDFELPDLEGNDSDDDLDFLSDSDETATKLDLARAYIDMGDQEGARDIIKEVLSEGNDQQKSEAEALLARIDA